MLSALSCNVPFYIVTTLKAQERQARASQLLSGFDNVCFITDGDIAHFNEELLSQYFISDINNKIKRGAVSCALNHLLCYKKIALGNHEVAVVLEDDFFLLRDFKGLLNKIVQESKSLSRGFLISLENSSLRFPGFWETKRGKHLYLASQQRCTGGYIIDRTGAQSCLSFTLKHKADREIDLWHEYLVSKNVVQLYWAHPPIIEQGSHNGLMESVIDGKRKSYKRVRWLAQKFFKQYVRRFFH